jgi:hypothetical protein
MFVKRILTAPDFVAMANSRRTYEDRTVQKREKRRLTEEFERIQALHEPQVYFQVLEHPDDIGGR